jgi:hypothetical protein
MFKGKRVQEIRTHILCSVTFFFENHAVYEIAWKNIVEPYRTHGNIPHAGYPRLEYKL